MCVCVCESALGNEATGAKLQRQRSPVPAAATGDSGSATRIKEVVFATDDVSHFIIPSMNKGKAPGGER